MEKINFTALTRFKTNKPYLLKKIIVTLVVIGVITYLVITRGIIELVSVAISFFLFRYLRVKKNKKEKIFKGLWQSYKNMFQKYIIDELPVDIEINEQTIDITLNNAEKFNGKILNENYIINKEDIKGIIYYEEDYSIIFNYEKVDIKLLCNAEQYNENISKQKGSVMFYLTSEIAEMVKNNLTENGYLITVSTDEKIKEEEIKKAIELTEAEKAEIEAEKKKEEELQDIKKKRFHVPTNEDIMKLLNGKLLKKKNTEDKKNELEKKGK